MSLETNALSASSPAAASDAARRTLEQIKSFNAPLADKAVRSGHYVGFAQGQRAVSLPQVIDVLERGQAVTMQVVKYEKLPTWLMVTVGVLGGAYPVLNGVNLKNMQLVHQTTIASLGELPTKWSNASLAT